MRQSISRAIRRRGAASVRLPARVLQQNVPVLSDVISDVRAIHFATYGKNSRSHGAGTSQKLRGSSDLLLNAAVHRRSDVTGVFCRHPAQ